MYTRISYIYIYIYTDTVEVIYVTIKILFTTNVFQDLYHGPNSSLCSLNINFAFAEFPQNISPYNNKEWKYEQYKVRSVSNPDTRLIILIAKHILLNLIASC
jgi:hypothetical protein